MTFPKINDLHLHCFVLCFVSFCRAHVLVELFACLEASYCARGSFTARLALSWGLPTGSLLIRRTSSKYKIQLRVLLTGFPHPAKPRERFQMALALVLNRETTFIRVRCLRQIINLLFCRHCVGLSGQRATLLLERPLGFDLYLS